MGRRRRKRFAAKSGTGQPRTIRAPIAEVPTSDPDLEGPSSSGRKRQKRPVSEYHIEGEKRRKFEHHQDEIEDVLTGQEDTIQGDTTLQEPQDDPIPDGESGTIKVRKDQRVSQGSPPTDDENESPILVTCGRNEGFLYLSKLRVVVNERCRTKCIRTGNTWWTPNEFQFVSGRGAAKDWKRTVKHSGQCLKTLLTNGVLCLATSPPKCLCKPCEQAEPCKALTSSEKQKEQEEERNDDVSDASENQNSPDKNPDNDDGVKVTSRGHDDAKRSNFRVIKVNRNGKRRVRDVVVDRKRTLNTLPVRKKPQKSSPGSRLDVVAFDDRLDLQEPKTGSDAKGGSRRRGSLVFRLSSASFRPVSVSGSPPHGAYTGNESDEEDIGGHAEGHRDSPPEVVTPVTSTGKSHDGLTSLADEGGIPDGRDDVRDRSDDVRDSSLVTPKTEVCETTETDERVPQPEPEIESSTRRKSDPKPEIDVSDITSGERKTIDIGSVKNSIGIKDDVTGTTVADVISTSSSSSTTSVVTGSRKSSLLDAVIAELKSKKKSRAAGVAAPSVSLVVGGAEGLKQVVSPATPLGTKLPPPATATLKTEFVSDSIRFDFKTDEDRSGVAPIRPPSLKPPISFTDTKPPSLKSTLTGGRTPDHTARIPSKSNASRKTDPDAAGERRKKTPSTTTTTTTPTFHPGAWGAAAAAAPTKFDAGGGGGRLDPAMTTFNISQLASIYGLGSSSMTSFPTSQTSYPFFPPYLFMGFPLQPLLPPFTSLPPTTATSDCQLPVGPSSAVSGSGQSRKRRNQHSNRNQGKGGSCDPFAALRKATLPPNCTPPDINLWRRLASDFSLASGRPLAETGSGSNSGRSPYAGSVNHPIWRPGVAASVAHAPRQADVMTSVGKSESRGGRYSCDDQGVLDLSKK